MTEAAAREHIDRFNAAVAGGSGDRITSLVIRFD
jgi:hypothetical protein